MHQVGRTTFYIISTYQSSKREWLLNTLPSLILKGFTFAQRQSLVYLIIFLIKEVTLLNDINPLALHYEGQWVNMANVTERN